MLFAGKPTALICNLGRRGLGGEGGYKYSSSQSLTLAALLIVHQFVARVTGAVEASLGVVTLVQTVAIVTFTFVDV